MFTAVGFCAMFDICVNIFSDRFDADREQIFWNVPGRCRSGYISITGSCLPSTEQAISYAQGILKESVLLLVFMFRIMHQKQRKTTANR